MYRVRYIFLWTCVVGLLLLPALSSVGYVPTDIEYVSVLLVSIFFAAIFSQIARVPYVGMIVLSSLTIFGTLLYFGSYLLQSDVFMACAGIGMVGYIILALRYYEKILILSAVVAFAQIFVAALAPSSFVVSLKEFAVARSNMPSVVHLMLDEHAGMAAIPTDAVPAEKIREFENEYVKNGFIVFTHAYTAERRTQYSLARLFNVEKADNSKLLTDESSLLHYSQSPSGYSILQSSTFDSIGRERVIDITQIEKMNFDPAIRNNPAVARDLIYNMETVREVFIKSLIPLSDRFSVAAYRVLELFCPDGKKTFGNVLLKKIQNKGMLPYVRLGRMHAFASRLALEQTTQRLACCGERGTYYFVHLLLPHYNYVFNEQCGILPFSEWRGRLIYSTKPEEALAERRNLYRLHFGQAVCTAHKIFKLTDVLAENQKISDTVVLVHSDHGARIAIENYEETKPAGYTKTNYEQDWRGAFIAIKIPNMDGRIIDEPVRLDEFYKNLMENHFQKLDIEKLMRMSDSPY